MNKPGRNDPCPCGSGKKYKKCHGASNVIAISPDLYNAELARLHSELVAFAFSEYEYELSKRVQQYLQPSFHDDEEIMELFIGGFTAWAILYEPIRDGQTIFDIFYKKQQNKIKHERVRRTIASWSGASPSIYEILVVKEEKVILQDLRTKDTYRIPTHESDLEEGDMVIGILIPFIQQHEFLLTMVEVFDVDEEVTQMAEALNDEDLIEDYPDILAKTLAMEMTSIEMEWDNPLYEMVANYFVSHMREKEADEDMITTGLFIWKLFTETTIPSFKKPGAYAAALEYVVSNALSEDMIVSQSKLAEEYDTTPATVSKNVRKLSQLLDEVDRDFENIVEEMVDEGLLPNGSGEFLDNYDEVDETIFDNSRLTMEKTMRDVQKAIEEQDFDSEEEMHQFIDKLLSNQDFLSSTPASPRDIAQDKLYEAQQTNGPKRKKLVKEALKIYPNSPDAYRLMAQEAKSVNEQYQLYHQAVIAGEKDLGKAFFRENKGHFWLMTETRPYMRAKAEFAGFQYHLGDKSSAITNFEELLELNPNDNQGIRYQLLPTYLEEGQYEKAEELLHQYDGEMTANFLFNDVLLHYFRDGLTHKTKSLLKQATKQNPYVKDYLTGKKRVPKREYNYIGVGDETEAIVYVQEHNHLWEKAKSLVNVLKKL